MAKLDKINGSPVPGSPVPGPLDPGSLSLEQIIDLPPSRLEAYRVAALAQIAFDIKAPTAARVAALKDLNPLGSGAGNQGPKTDVFDPGEMDLAQINKELGSI